MIFVCGASRVTIHRSVEAHNYEGVMPRSSSTDANGVVMRMIGSLLLGFLFLVLSAVPVVPPQQNDVTKQFWTDVNPS
jgi:hypothetical protein